MGEKMEGKGKKGGREREEKGCKERERWEKGGEEGGRKEDTILSKLLEL